jgi:hypothetical protein
MKNLAWADYGLQTFFVTFQKFSSFANAFAKLPRTPVIVLTEDPTSDIAEITCEHVPRISQVIVESLACIIRAFAAEAASWVPFLRICGVTDEHDGRLLHNMLKGGNWPFIASFTKTRAADLPVEVDAVDVDRTVFKYCCGARRAFVLCAMWLLDATNCKTESGDDIWPHSKLGCQSGSCFHVVDCDWEGTPFKALVQALFSRQADRSAKWRIYQALFSPHVKSDGVKTDPKKAASAASSGASSSSSAEVDPASSSSSAASIVGPASAGAGLEQVTSFSPLPPSAPATLATVVAGGGAWAGPSAAAAAAAAVAQVMVRDRNPQTEKQKTGSGAGAKAVELTKSVPERHYYGKLGTEGRRATGRMKAAGLSRKHQFAALALLSARVATFDQRLRFDGPPEPDLGSPVVVDTGTAGAPSRRAPASVDPAHAFSQGKQPTEIAVYNSTGHHLLGIATLLFADDSAFLTLRFSRILDFEDEDLKPWFQSTYISFPNINEPGHCPIAPHAIDGTNSTLYAAAKDKLLYFLPVVISKTICAVAEHDVYPLETLQQQKLRSATAPGDDWKKKQLLGSRLVTNTNMALEDAYAIVVLAIGGASLFARTAEEERMATISHQFLYEKKSGTDAGQAAAAVSCLGLLAALESPWCFVDDVGDDGCTKVTVRPPPGSGKAGSGDHTELVMTLAENQQICQWFASGAINRYCLGPVNEARSILQAWPARRVPQLQFVVPHALPFRMEEPGEQAVASLVMQEGVGKICAGGGTEGGRLVKALGLAETTVLPANLETVYNRDACTPTDGACIYGCPCHDEHCDVLCEFCNTIQHCSTRPGWMDYCTNAALVKLGGALMRDVGGHSTVSVRFRFAPPFPPAREPVIAHAGGATSWRGTMAGKTVAQTADAFQFESRDADVGAGVVVGWLPAVVLEAITTPTVVVVFQANGAHLVVVLQETRSGLVGSPLFRYSQPPVPGHGPGSGVGGPGASVLLHAVTSSSSATVPQPVVLADYEPFSHSGQDITGALLQEPWSSTAFFTPVGQLPRHPLSRVFDLVIQGLCVLPPLSLKLTKAATAGNFFPRGPLARDFAQGRVFFAVPGKHGPGLVIGGHARARRVVDIFGSNKKGTKNSTKKKARLSDADGDVGEPSGGVGRVVLTEGRMFAMDAAIIYRGQDYLDLNEMERIMLEVDSPFVACKEAWKVLEIEIEVPEFPGPVAVAEGGGAVLFSAGDSEDWLTMRMTAGQAALGAANTLSHEGLRAVGGAVTFMLPSGEHSVNTVQGVRCDRGAGTAAALAAVAVSSHSSHVWQDHTDPTRLVILALATFLDGGTTTAEYIALYASPWGPLAGGATAMAGLLRDTGPGPATFPFNLCDESVRLLSQYLPGPTFVVLDFDGKGTAYTQNCGAACATEISVNSAGMCRVSSTLAECNSKCVLIRGGKARWYGVTPATASRRRVEVRDHGRQVDPPFGLSKNVQRFLCSQELAIVVDGEPVA